jgi:hypothetical protein
MPEADLDPNTSRNLAANTEVKITNGTGTDCAIAVTVNGFPQTTTNYTISGNTSQNILAQANYTVANQGTVTLRLNW